MLKRFFSFAVMALMIAALPSCGKKEQPPRDKQDQQEEQEQEEETASALSLEGLDESNVNTSGSGSGSTGNEGKKKVSLLGDSITTYQGYTTYPGNYQYPKSDYNGFTSVTQTWWHQLIYQMMTDAVLEVNSSYTGTCVQNTTSKGHPGLGFLQRYVELGNPDVIIINGGTNDSWSYQLPVGSLDFTLATEDLDTYQFAQAYDKLIRLLKEKYPEAQICCVIGDAVMDASYSDYAKVIRDVCVHYELPYAEVVFADRASLTYDNVHPNVEGMADMAEQIWDALQPYLEPDGQRIRQTSDPRMKIYFPKGKAENSRMVVVCPGGGYSGIPGADGYEGAFWKDLFNEAGYALAVLYYTLPEGDYTKPVGDMENAMKKIRGNAARWKVDTEKVGVMGFSAGGHLASYAATHFTGTAKPDFQVLFYPVITMENGMTHAGSRNKLLGADPSAELVSQFSNEKHVSASTCRAFITYAENDGTVPPSYNGEAYSTALSSAEVPVELHVYDGSRHGWHWGSFIFDGVSVSDGTKYEHLDEVKAALATWLKSF